MKIDEKVLVIDANLTYVTGFLLLVEDERVELLETWRIQRTVDLKQLVQAVEYKFKGRYDSVEVVKDRSEWFKNGLKWMFPEGLTIGISIEGDHTIVGANSYGRIFNLKKYSVGITQSLDVTLTISALEFLVNWLKIIHKKEGVNDLINYLGLRRQYPGLQMRGSEYDKVMLAVLRIILQEVHPGREVFGGGAKGFSKGAHRVLISGDMAREVEDYGELVLAVIDGLELEGIWEIYLDTKSLLCPVGYSSSTKKIDLDDIGIIPLGSVIVPTHGYKWGENLGTMLVDVGLSEDPVVDLKSGEIVRLPLDKDVKGAISLNVKQNVDIPGYEGLDGISGGELGLIVDLRGQLMPDIEDTKLYKKYYRHWKEALS